MNQFGLIFRHYIKRIFMDKVSLGLQLGLPIFLIVIMPNLQGGFPEVPEAGDLWARVAVNFIISFGFFGGQYAMGHIFDDLKDTRKWRMLMAPVEARTYTLAAMAGSMIVSFVQSMLILIAAMLFTSANFTGLIPMLIVTLILMNLLSHAFCYFFVVVCNKYATANAITNVAMIGLAALGGGIIMGIDMIVDLPAFSFVHDYMTPLSIGNQIMTHGAGMITNDMMTAGEFLRVSETNWNLALMNIGFLIGLTVLFSCLSFVARKVKRV